MPDTRTLGEFINDELARILYSDQHGRMLPLTGIQAAELATEIQRFLGLEENGLVTAIGASLLKNAGLTGQDL